MGGWGEAVQSSRCRRWGPEALRQGDSRDGGDVVDSGHIVKVEGRTSSQID